jgi:hypothetical protein
MLDGAPRQHTPPEVPSWLIDDFVDKTPGVRQALLVSSDGLLMHQAGALDTDQADSLSAITSGLVSSGHAAGRLISEPRCQQMMFRYAGSHLLIMGVYDLASVAVVVNKGAKLDVVYQAMTRLVEGTGRVLAPQPRDDTPILPPQPGEQRP